MPKAWGLAVLGDWQYAYRAKFPKGDIEYDIVTWNRSRTSIKLVRILEDGQVKVSYTDLDQKLELIKKPPQLFGRPKLPATFKEEHLESIP